MLGRIRDKLEPNARFTGLFSPSRTCPPTPSLLHVAVSVGKCTKPVGVRCSRVSGVYRHISAGTCHLGTHSNKAHLAGASQPGDPAVGPKLGSPWFESCYLDILVQEWGSSPPPRLPQGVELCLGHSTDKWVVGQSKLHHSMVASCRTRRGKGSVRGVGETLKNNTGLKCEKEKLGSGEPGKEGARTQDWRLAHRDQAARGVKADPDPPRQQT